jgi:hypothetical protein
MPLTSKKLRVAKCLCQNTPTAFSRPTLQMPKTEGSEYSVSDNGTDVESSDESGTHGVEALQHIYSVFLPPHLCLEEKGQEKHRKINNRKAVYSGDSRTALWRKGVAMKCAAEGCTMLDTFVVRKVHPLSVKQWRRELRNLFQLEAAA